METNTTITHGLPPQEVPVQTPLLAGRQNNPSIEKSIPLGASDIVLRVICLIFCLGVLVAAAVALSAINAVDDRVDDYNAKYGFDYYKYKHEDSYRAAAGWLVLVAISAILYHPIGIVVRILYYSPNMPLRFLTFTIYAIANGIVCLLFALALLAGAISNAKYAADNNKLYDDYDCDSEGGYDLDVCEDLERVANAEATAASLAFFAVATFVALCVVLLIGGIQKLRGGSNTGTRASETPYVQMPN